MEPPKPQKKSEANDMDNKDSVIPKIPLIEKGLPVSFEGRMFHNGDNEKEYVAPKVKPPIGCKPTRFVCFEQIKELAQAIERYADYSGGSRNKLELIKRWSKEIERLATLIHEI